MENPTLATATFLLGIVLAPAIASQVETTSKPQKPDASSDAKRAVRLVRALELQDRRPAAVAEILLMGRKAVPAIERALTDPRPEVVCCLVRIIDALGDKAKTTVPVLQSIAEGKDPQLAYAARWGLASFKPIGITLLSDRKNNRILEVDRSGKEVWSLGDLAEVSDAKRLSTGRYLVALWGAGEVREIDRKGKVLWRCKGDPPPRSATRLPNGNTLICTPFRGETVKEVTPKGKIVWSFAPGHAWSAQRLTDGRTLVPQLQKRVIRIVDAKRELVGTIPSSFGIVGIDITARGTILTCPHGGRTLEEIDFKGKLIHELKLPGKPHTAQRLPDGGTAVAGEDFAALYDSKGKPVWILKAGCYGAAVHY